MRQVAGSMPIICVNKVTRRLMNMHSDVTRTSIGDAKKAVRYCQNINYLEAIYRVLQRAGALETANQLCLESNVVIDVRSMMQPETHIKGVERYKGNWQYKDNDEAWAEAYAGYIAALRFFQRFTKEFDAEANNIGQKNIDWNLVESVEFQLLSSDTLQFEPISHKTKKGKK